MALISWFHPVANTQAHTESLVFEIDESLKEPKPYPTYAPTRYTNLPKQKTKVTKAKVSGQNCSCVNYVKTKIGYKASVGAARNWPVNSHTPSVGAVIVTYESRLGHVALITKIEDGYLYLDEANYSRCRVTSGRKLSINSSLIKGYYVP